MSPAQIDRRGAVRLLAALGVSFGLPALSYADGKCASMWAEALDSQAVRNLGREYLAAHPHDVHLGEVIPLLKSDSAIASLAEMMHADYAAGRMLNLSGWFISTTEARIFAALSRCWSATDVSAETSCASRALHNNASSASP